jgi:hypothetical protein
MDGRAASAMTEPVKVLPHSVCPARVFPRSKSAAPQSKARARRKGYDGHEKSRLSVGIANGRVLRKVNSDASLEAIRELLYELGCS